MDVLSCLQRGNPRPLALTVMPPLRPYLPAAAFHWTGAHVSGSRVAAVVKYHGPTDNRGSKWTATIKRDTGTVWRASVPFADGPITAALKAANKGDVQWAALTCHSIDPDTYCIGF